MYHLFFRSDSLSVDQDEDVIRLKLNTSLAPGVKVHIKNIQISQVGQGWISDEAGLEVENRSLLLQGVASKFGRHSEILDNRTKSFDLLIVQKSMFTKRVVKYFKNRWIRITVKISNPKNICCGRTCKSWQCCRSQKRIITIVIRNKHNNVEDRSHFFWRSWPKLSPLTELDFSWDISQ